MKFVFVFMIFIIAFCGQSSCNDKDAVFESLDGSTLLIVSNEYFYLGPSDRPASKNFLKDYGEKVESIDMNNGTCVSLGILKIAKFEGHTNVCDGITLIREPDTGDSNISIYTGKCFQLEGGKCNSSAKNEESIVTYSYKIDKNIGVSEIYLAGKDVQTPNNTLRLKSGQLELP